MSIKEVKQQTIGTQSSMFDEPVVAIGKKTSKLDEVRQKISAILNEPSPVSAEELVRRATLGSVDAVDRYNHASYLSKLKQ